MTSSQMSNGSPSVRDLWSAGRLEEAIRQQIATLNAHARQHGAPRPDDTHLLAVLLFAFKDFPASAQAFAQTQRLAPDFPAIQKNLGMAQVFQVSSVQCLDWYQAERRASDDHIEHLCQQQDNQRRQVQATQIRQDTTYRVQQGGGNRTQQGHAG